MGFQLKIKSDIPSDPGALLLLRDEICIAMFTINSLFGTNGKLILSPYINQEHTFGEKNAMFLVIVDNI